VATPPVDICRGGTSPERGQTHTSLMSPSGGSILVYPAPVLTSQILMMWRSVEMTLHNHKKHVQC
jgi:hypothetical protein